jgi:outer membrane protein assembly factor BamE (lipoprotein component of BamABCDE complex)
MAMSKRKLLLLGLSCFALVLLAWATFLAVCPLTPRHHIDRAGVGALREGMTEAEVVQVLGVPAGDYSSVRRVYTVNPVTSVFESAAPIAWKEWIGDEAKVRIGFDPNGKVWSISHSRPYYGEAGPFALLRRLLSLTR